VASPKPKNTWGKSALDGLMMGLGFSIVLIILGAMRELIGSGTLFDQSALLLGDLGNTLSITVFEDYQGTLLAIHRKRMIALPIQQWLQKKR
jgi:electron transport complex protein RnfE